MESFYNIATSRPLKQWFSRGFFIIKDQSDGSVGRTPTNQVEDCGIL